MRIPEVGEVWLTEDFFNPENAARPAVVVSVTKYSKCRQDVVVLPISSKIERAKCATDCLLHDWREAGLNKPSYVKCNPITLKIQMLQNYVGVLSDADFQDVLSKLRIVFGF